MSDVVAPRNEAASLAMAEKQLARQAPIIASARVLEQQSKKYQAFAVRAKEMLVLLKSELDAKATRIEQLESALAQRSVERATAALEPQARASQLSAATAEILVEQAKAQSLQNELLLAPLLRENAALEERCRYLEERTAPQTATAPPVALLNAHADFVRVLQSELRASVTSDRAAQQQLAECVDEYRTALVTLRTSLGEAHTAAMNALRTENERANAARDQEIASQHAVLQGEMVTLQGKCADLKRAWSIDCDALRASRQQTLVEHSDQVAALEALEAQAAGDHAAALLESSDALRVTEEALFAALATGESALAEHVTAEAAHEAAMRTLNTAIARSAFELDAQQRKHNEEMHLLRASHEQRRDASLDGVAEAAAASRALQSAVVERNAAEASLAVAEQRGVTTFEQMQEMEGAFEEYRSVSSFLLFARFFISLFISLLTLILCLPLVQVRSFAGPRRVVASRSRGSRGASEGRGARSETTEQRGRSGASRRQPRNRALHRGFAGSRGCCVSEHAARRAPRGARVSVGGAREGARWCRRQCRGARARGAERARSAADHRGRCSGGRRGGALVSIDEQRRNWTAAQAGGRAQCRDDEDAHVARDRARGPRTLETRAREHGHSTRRGGEKERGAASESHRKYSSMLHCMHRPPFFLSLSLSLSLPLTS